MQLKILFDKEKIDNRFETGWGLSYLLEDTLFDTGEKFEYLSANMKTLDINFDKIKNIVISHNHWDHRGGLFGLLNTKNDLKVYGCSDFYKEFKKELDGHDFNEVTGFMQITKDIYSTGPFKSRYKDIFIEEQSLIIKSGHGISVICGCTHMGLLELIKKIRILFKDEKINFLIGGFHLLDSDNRFIEYIVKEIQKIGVEKIGPSHCTGYEAIKLFKQSYGKNCIEIKTGMIIDL